MFKQSSIMQCLCALMLLDSCLLYSGSIKDSPQALDFKTETPIKYLVVIYPENCSFDHFFGTYPFALNPPGEPFFKAKPNTPSINGLTDALLNHNTNLLQPFRLERTEIAQCAPKHHYTQLQQAAHAGLMDRYIQLNENCPIVMGYYDGNTVTALWNYAQRFAMSDNFHSTTFTPSTPGAINLISGQTHGATPPNLTVDEEIYTIKGTIINDPDPFFDKCSNPPIKVKLEGTNIGNLLNEKGITWGWFQGGFGNCDQKHEDATGRPIRDYIPHHEPFQYYADTSNPDHLPPSSPFLIGQQDQANHQYDLEDFWTAASIHHLPAVSYLKPAAYQDGHPEHSDPLSLQTFLVETINRLQKLPEWKQMAIIIAWDDAGGLYDHEMPPIINQSRTRADALVAPGNSGNPPPGSYQGRLAYGMRVPFLILSPFAKSNFVDHTLTDQTSILRFIEDNWSLGRIGNQSFDEYAGSLLNFFDFSKRKGKPLFLDPDTGLPIEAAKK